MKVNTQIQSLTPYRSKQIDVPIVLNANETDNYLFPTGFLLTTDFSKYPNTNADQLRDALADKYTLSRENFIIGNGSTELLELTVKSFTEPNDNILSFDPSFAMYQIYSTIHNTNLIPVPAEVDMTQSIDTMILFAKEYNPSVIFICTPNNPTGMMIKQADIIRLLDQTDALVIVDEAYMDFAFERESMTSFVNQYENLLVARTFSKAYGLAGIRLGYMIGNTELINTLLKVKLPYSVNRGSIRIGLNALNQTMQVQSFLTQMVERRDTLYKEMKDLGIDVYPSEANFLFVTSRYDLQTILLEKGILIRSFDNGTYRITVGSECDNATLIEALKEVYYEN